MGITGLIPFLQKSSRRANIREFSGATVAIDAYCWLHKGAFGCAEKLIMKEPTTMYVAYCMKYVNMLLSHNIKPILVFDGQNLPAKAMTEVKRRQNRDISRRKGMDLMRAGRVSEGRNLLRRSLDVTHAMALEFIRECRRRNVDCIVAPYEADAQLAYLNLEGIAHVVITEDSDLMLFGCKTVIFKMDVNGNGVLVENSKLYLSMGVRQDLFSFAKFRLMCILSGCDYLESLSGIGLSKACKFVKNTSETDIYRALQKLASNLNMRSLEVSEEYRKAVVAADLTFRCQLVFDPLQRRQVPLTPPGVGEQSVGEMKDAATAFQMALGNRDPRDLRVVDDYDPDKLQMKPRNRAEEAMRAPHQSIWSKSYSRSAQPKPAPPTILRLGTAGKRVLTSVQLPPAAKRDAQDEENCIENEEEKVDLIKLYSESKRPKTALLAEPSQYSRYFITSHEIDPALRFMSVERKSLLDQLDSSPVDSSPSLSVQLLNEELGSPPTNSCDASILDGMNKITTNSSGESCSTTHSFSSFESCLDEILSPMPSPLPELTLSEISTTDVTAKSTFSLSQSSLSSCTTPSSQADAKLSPCRTSFSFQSSLSESSLSSWATPNSLPDATLFSSRAPSSSPSSLTKSPCTTASCTAKLTEPQSQIANTTNKPALRAFQFKAVGWKNSPNRPSGISSLDTVGTDRSVFFAGASSSPMTTSQPGKLRLGLSRHKPSHQPKQTLLSKFGFQTRPKIQVAQSTSIPP